MSNQATIWDFLKSKGLTECGVAGAMGNIKAESGFKSTNLQDTANKILGMTDEEYTTAVDNGTYTAFCTDGKGYGICQWTSADRKAKVLQKAKELGVSVGNLEAQLQVLWEELCTGYTRTLLALQTATTVQEASDMFMVDFERPGTITEATKSARAVLGEAQFDLFATKNVIAEKEYGMKVKDFIGKLKDVVDNYKTLYVMGCFGAPLTGGNVARYKTNHSYNKTATRQAIIDKMQIKIRLSLALTV